MVFPLGIDENSLRGCDGSPSVNDDWRVLNVVKHEIWSVAPWILYATLGGILDGKCIYCSDLSACNPTPTVSWTPLPSFYWVSCVVLVLVVVSTLFWMSSHYSMWIVIGYVVVELQRDFSPERVNSPLSLDTSSRCQYVIVTYCHLALRLIYLSLWVSVVTVWKE
jgi:hypothetical protein